MASYSLTMTNPGWCSGKMTVTHTFSSNKRSATVTVTLKLWRSDGGKSYNYDASRNFYIKIGDSTLYYTIESVSGTSGVTKTRSRTLTLNADGTLSVAVKVGGSLSGTTFKITGNNSKTYKITGGAKKTYTVKYDANGGENAPSSQTKTYGTTLTLRSGTPTRDPEGTTTYTFSKWKSSYNNSYHYPSGSYTTNASTTMTAVWKTTTGYDMSYSDGVENKATIAGVEEDTTYDTVTNMPSDKTITAGSSYTVGSAPSRYGYNFTNWLTMTYSAGGGIPTMGSCNAGATITPTGDITFIAIWLPWSHTVTFNANGGTGNVPSNFTKTTGTQVFIENESETEDNIPTRHGYEFVAWNSKSDGTGTSYQSGDEYTYTQDGGTVTLYAIWASTDIYLYSNGNCKAIEFVEGGTVTMFNDGGQVCMPQFVEGSTLSISSSGFNVEELIEK